MLNMTNNITTWNGAISLSTSGSSTLSLFYKSVRGIDEETLQKYICESAKENIIDTFLISFYIRDCRGGKGERNLGIQCLTSLFINYPEYFMKIVRLIPEYGRWDDLLHFFPNNLDVEFLRNCSSKKMEIIQKFQLEIVKIFKDELILSRVKMEAGEPISLCAKWAPSENDSKDKKYGLVKTLGFNKTKYRKEYLTPLRSYLKIVETFMCSNRWDDIEYNKVPSCAIKRLKNAFEKHSPETFLAWKSSLKSGESKVNAKQLFPYELVKEVRIKRCSDEVCEAQWKILEEETNKLGLLKDSVVVVDTSSSMFSPNYLPLDVAISLGLLISNTVEGVFHNHVITFNYDPIFVELKNGSLYDRYNHIQSIPWGGSTDIQKTFDLILSKGKENNLTDEDMPKRIFIISDMQFNNSGCNMTNFELIDSKYKIVGYTRPQIIFWNVNGSTNDFPVSILDNGTALISGFSASIMKTILQCKDFDPYSIMKLTLDSNRYNIVKTMLHT